MERFWVSGTLLRIDEKEFQNITQCVEAEMEERQYLSSYFRMGVDKASMWTWNNYKYVYMSNDSLVDILVPFMSIL